jgi:ketosteroid isomerase-like protein
MGQAEERSARLVRALAASVTGDTSRFEELYTADVTAWSPAVMVSSRDELAAEVVGRLDAFSDIEYSVDTDVVGDKAYAEWVVTAVHSGPLVVDDDFVIEPTGHRVTMRGVTIAAFSGDRICALRQYWDELALVEGLGFLPKD